MTAIELANQLDHESDLGECKHYEAAAMLRKQYGLLQQQAIRIEQLERENEELRKQLQEAEDELDRRPV
jgi:cell shape-determining protein MreC